MGKYKYFMLATLFLVVTLTILLVSIEESKICQLNSSIAISDLLSVDWVTEWTIQPPALPLLGAQNAIGISLVNSKGQRLFNTIYAYKNRLVASAFRHINDPVFYPTTSRTWTPDISTGARDIFRDVRCTDGIDVFLDYRCVSVTQYNRYIVVFNAPISEAGISKDEFENILQRTDKLLTQCDSAQ